jgi:hypothetical protein
MLAALSGQRISRPEDFDKLSPRIYSFLLVIMKSRSTFASQPPCRIQALFLLLAALTGCGSGSATKPPPPPPPEVPLTRLSTDTFTNASSQHATEVEPDTFAYGSAIMSVFQVGRIFDGGAADIGFAFSTDSGANWTNGFLPGITIFEGGTFLAVSDPAVAFDAAHGVWLVVSLPISASTDTIAVSRSVNGINWENPVQVNATPDADKGWIVCDNSSSSPFFGHCYVEWDDPSANGLIWMSTSTDGGLTWQTQRNTADMTAGLGGQPLVQPNGTVVVPIEDMPGANMLAFRSTDGGASWESSVKISTISDHLVAGGLRTSALPSAEIDAAGTIFIVWQDCRFRSGCSSNDLVLSTSADGVSWSAPSRIPLDTVTSGADHFIPGLSVDAGTSGTTAHLALTYYYYPQASCSSAACQLEIGFVSSQDGGNTWTAPQILAGPMTLGWLASTSQGFMVGDYISTSFLAGKALGAFAVARANSGTVFDEAIFSTASPLSAFEGMPARAAAADQPVPGARSDHPPRQFYDLERRRYPVPPPHP